MERKKFVLDKKPKKIWSLNQMKIGESISGIPKAYHYKNKNSHEFIKLDLDYGHAICHIYFLIFSFPIQKLLHNKYHNSFELVRFYREVTGEGIDEGITTVYDIDWLSVIDFLNGKEIIKIKCINKNINGFKNIVFLE